jgi:hypothetical protein
MIAMDDTIAGAASGETALNFAAPKGSLSQAKGQKSTEYLFVMLKLLAEHIIFIILMTKRLENIQSLFFI